MSVVNDLILEDRGTSAKIVADSIAATGDRVTSFEIRFHRFTLAELNTHCIFARNSASSRAIPVTKQLERYVIDPALPVSWPAEQKGMTGGDELVGQDLADAAALFERLLVMTWDYVEDYVRSHEPEHRLHKSLLNRLLEPMQWHTALVTASSYENFFDQRCSKDAQPELRKVAEMMRELHSRNEPLTLERGMWHAPYVEDHEYDELTSSAAYDYREISVARCARTSYMGQDGTRDFSVDEGLYRRLVAGNHWSPFEHVCTPDPANAHYVDIYDPDQDAVILGSVRLPRLGKFLGWQQFRHVIEGRQKVQSYR